VIPEQVNSYDTKGALEVEASMRQFDAALRQNGITNARTFSTRTKLVNGS